MPPRSGKQKKGLGEDSARPGSLPRRKHLRRLDAIFSDLGAGLFYITVTARQRRPVLCSPKVAAIIVDALRGAPSDHGWMAGRYVVMPEHVHFFCAPAGNRAKSLSSFVGFWKRGTAKKIRETADPHFRWQAEFFDHLLRRSESYAAKWEYVRANPVQAGLVARAEDWPYQGEICQLSW